MLLVAFSALIVHTARQEESWFQNRLLLFIQAGIPIPRLSAARELHHTLSHAHMHAQHARNCPSPLSGGI
jgi:hypothetical protein